MASNYQSYYQLRFVDKILKRGQLFSDKDCFNYVEKEKTLRAITSFVTVNVCVFFFGHMEISALYLVFPKIQYEHKFVFSILFRLL